MDKKNDKTNIVMKIILALIAALTIFYVIYMIVIGNVKRVDTVSANMITYYDAITADGYFIRDEEYVKYNGGGILSYNIKEGDKVSKNEAVASVFTDMDTANLEQEASKIVSHIDSLKKLDKSAGTINRSPDEIDNSIADLLSQANINSASGDIGAADSNISQVLYSINERQLVTGKVTGFYDKIQELETEVKGLRSMTGDSSKGKKVNASVTGYFSGTVDGYEKTLSSKDIEKLMPGDLSDDKLQAKNVDSDVIGKIINGVYWYVVCTVNAEDALRIKNSYSVSLDIPMVSNELIDCELYAINQENKASEALIILQGSYMSPEMTNIRRTDISIVTDTYRGLYIPKKAVHQEELTRTVKKDGHEVTETKTVPGVYIKTGTKVDFRQIIPIYSGEDFIISKYSTGDYDETFSDDVKLVGQYDQIITEGANLYDGKIVARRS